MRRRIGWDGLVFLGLVALLIGLGAYYALSPGATAALRDESPWYGNWVAVAFSVLLFSAFVVGFLRPFKRRDWRGLGIAEAYLVALFTEMFGLPLTIYLLGSVLGFEVGFSGLEGHLWATLLNQLGLLPQAQGVALVMGVSIVLILAGLALMAGGWWAVWRSKGELVTGGLYAWMRHPQYAGFILIIIAFLVQWPTVITLIMFPILVVTYRRLARREETEMEAEFGERYTEYSGGGMMGPGMMGGWGGMMGGWPGSVGGSWGGALGWLFPLIGWLIPLGLLVLLVVGGVWLFRQIGGPQALSPEPGPVAPGKTCPSCGRTVQTDWQICPYCGQGLV